MSTRFDCGGRCDSALEVFRDDGGRLAALWRARSCASNKTACRAAQKLQQKLHTANARIILHEHFYTRDKSTVIVTNFSDIFDI